MPPKQPPGPPFDKNERVFCFHREMLYEAKVLDVRSADEGEGWQYKIHYKGWKDRFDEWAPQDRLRKFNDENKELADQMKAQYATHSKGGSKQAKTKVPGKVPGSELGSARGSEERMPAATQSGRGPRRARDYELEHVSGFKFLFPYLTAMNFRCCHLDEGVLLFRLSISNPTAPSS